MAKNVSDQHIALRSELLSYRKENKEQRKQRIDKWKQKVAKLPDDIKTKSEALNAYITMANASQMIQYADIINRMENQQWFNIMFDFVGLDKTFQKDEFKSLSDYFEIQLINGRPTGSMRCKTPLNDITPQIWELFRNAQKDLLKQNGKSATFDLMQLGISKVADDQLYPICIQGMGAAENHAVDRTSINEKGQYRFAESFGLFLSPGGGMISIQDLPLNSSKVETKLKQMIDEHLEEEHGNLYLKAHAFLDQIDANQFRDKINSIVNNFFEAKADKPAKINKPELFLKLREITQSDKINHEKLRELIEQINLVLDSSESLVKKELNSLKASLQVETFKLTEGYTKAVEFTKENSVEVELEQYLDTRALGGKQIGHAFVMSKSLETFFAALFNHDELCFADDLAGSNAKNFTLLQLLARTRDIKFSHIAIPLAHTEIFFQDESSSLDKFWSSKDYHIARTMLSVDNDVAQAFRNLIQRIDNSKTDPQLGIKILYFIDEVISLRKQYNFSDDDTRNVLSSVNSLLKGEIEACEFQKDLLTRMSGYPKLANLVALMLAICAVSIALGLVAGAAAGVTCGVGLSTLGFYKFYNDKRAIDEHGQQMIQLF
jgi:hypothetical protein